MKSAIKTVFLGGLIMINTIPATEESENDGLKTIGMIGGTSWESTALYYKLLNQSVHEHLGGLNSAKILLHSLNYDPTDRGINVIEQIFKINRMKLNPLNKNKELIPEIAELKLQEFGYLAPEKTLDDFVHGLKTHLNDRELPIAYILLNEANEFIGTFSIREHDMDTHQDLTPWVGSILVAPDKRNQGIGAYLVAQAESMAKEMGFSQLYLFTPNKEAWYQKLGWETIEYAHFKTVPVAVMFKKLN